MVANRTAALVLLILLSTAVDVSGYDYAVVQFTSDGVRVDVRISADQSWQSPFSETITVIVGIIPQTPITTQVNISQVLVSVHKLEPDDTYTLVAAAQSGIGEGVFNGSIANITSHVTLSGSLSGTQCYFAVLAAGTYSNGTHDIAFIAISSENLVGPFSITPSVTSPQSLVGLALMVGFSLFLAAGIRGVRRSRSQTRQQKPLLKE